MVTQKQTPKMVSAFFEGQHSSFVSFLVLLQIHKFVHLGIPLIATGSFMF